MVVFGCMCVCVCVRTGLITGHLFSCGRKHAINGMRRVWMSLLLRRWNWRKLSSYIRFVFFLMFAASNHSPAAAPGTSSNKRLKSCKIYSKHIRTIWIWSLNSMRQCRTVPRVCCYAIRIYVNQMRARNAEEITYRVHKPKKKNEIKYNSNSGDGSSSSSREQKKTTKELQQQREKTEIKKNTETQLVLFSGFMCAIGVFGVFVYILSTRYSAMALVVVLDLHGVLYSAEICTAIVREYCTENDCLRWRYVVAMPKFCYFAFVFLSLNRNGDTHRNQCWTHAAGIFSPKHTYTRTPGGGTGNPQFSHWI